MRIMGVDPGTIHMGWGVIDYDGTTFKYVLSEVISMPQRLPLAQRLCNLHDRLTSAVEMMQPEVVAIEQPFVGKNARTALAIGQAQGVALMVAHRLGVRTIKAYTPGEVKRAATGYGASGKAAVAHMVRQLLDVGDRDMGLDETDALAAALAYAGEPIFHEVAGLGVAP